jgi:hypothetical protein
MTANLPDIFGGYPALDVKGLNNGVICTPDKPWICFFGFAGAGILY